jgi:hypothetical protein
VRQSGSARRIQEGDLLAANNNKKTHATTERIRPRIEQPALAERTLYLVVIETFVRLVQNCALEVKLLEPGLTLMEVQSVRSEAKQGRRCNGKQA